MIIPMNDKRNQVHIAYQPVKNILHQQLSEQEETISQLKQLLLEKNKILLEREEIISEKDQIILEKEKTLSEKDQIILEKEKMIAKKDERICLLLRHQYCARLRRNCRCDPGGAR